MSFLAQTTTTTGVNFPTIVFTLAVWSATVFALIALAMPDQTPEQRARIKAVATSGAGAALFFSIWATQTQAANAAGGAPGGELLEQHSWLSSFPFPSTYHLDADGLGLGLLLLVSVVFFCASLAAWRNDRRVKLLSFCMLILETAFLGVLVAYDWLLFLFFWSLPVAPVYLLVRGFGRGHRARAASRYAIASLLTTALLILVAGLITVQGNLRAFDMGTLPTLPGTGQAVCFWLTAAAFLLTMAVVPVHSALLDLEEDSTGALAAVFGAVLPTMGAYGLLHVTLGFFPIAVNYSLFFAALAVVTVLWSGVMALRADDLRRLIGHAGNVLMGLVLLGVAGHTTISLTGATYILIARGLAVALLMLAASAIQERTRRIRISQLGGLAWQAPHLAAFWGVGILTASGIPLLGGFFGELLLFTGAFPAHRWTTVVVLGGTLLLAGVLLWTAQRVFAGAEHEGFSRVRDLGVLEITYLGILAAVSLFFGILPAHFDTLFMNGATNILYPLSAG